MNVPDKLYKYSTHIVLPTIDSDNIDEVSIVVEKHVNLLKSILQVTTPHCTWDRDICRAIELEEIKRMDKNSQSLRSMLLRDKMIIIDTSPLSQKYHEVCARSMSIYYDGENSVPTGFIGVRNRYVFVNIEVCKGFLTGMEMRLAVTNSFQCALYRDYIKDSINTTTYDMYVLQLRLGNIPTGMKFISAQDMISSYLEKGIIPKFKAVIYIHFRSSCNNRFLIPDILYSECMNIAQENTFDEIKKLCNRYGCNNIVALAAYSIGEDYSLWNNSLICSSDHMESLLSYVLASTS